ncbi:hypothetical protein E3C22_18085 [Jiella endophytica]|uniref:Uncharacterized protein n=1 Tax=Jiella endophytica TaxID=2558362 RepID=A0A4Y8RFM9_9HYPH|nr:hypothetical protein [Jiella endophytica]TFF20799.1 hypothetical protein E3C22_18085 [Jiella endophytica]
MTIRPDFPTFDPAIVAFTRARIKADPAGRLDLSRTYRDFIAFEENRGRAAVAPSDFAEALAVMAASVGGGRFGDAVTGLAPIFPNPLADFFEATFAARMGAMLAVEMVKQAADDAGFTHREVLSFARARGHELRRNPAGPDFLTDLTLAVRP